MAMLNQEFTTDTLPQGNGGDFEPLPAGNYNVRIVKADLTDNKAGTGSYIKMRLDVIGPTHQGRVLFANLNIHNASAKAEEFGRQQLGDIMRAIGIAKVTDTDQLIGGELSVKVEVKNDEQYGPGNEIKGYKPIAGPAHDPRPQASYQEKVLVADSATAKKPTNQNTAHGVQTDNQTQNATGEPAKKSPPWMKK